jgi:hypothetical protein
MGKRKSQKSNDFPIGSISPAGYIAQVATRRHDGRKKNPTKNFRDGSLF